MSDARVRLGVSACLLGERVRHDGGHKRDRYLTDVLGAYVEWVPVCPEVELGLGVPRPTIRLEGTPDAPRLMEPTAGHDLTTAMTRFARRRARDLAALDLHGYVLKSKSPSCGMARVPVRGSGGRRSRRGRGTFASVLMDRLPLLPVEDEERLAGAAAREHFVERVFAYRRWTDLVRRRPRPPDVVAFHERHRLTILSHGRTRANRLDRLVAQAGALSGRAFARAYGTAFMTALAARPTRRQHAVVLDHLATTLADGLDGAEAAELGEGLTAYRQAAGPRSVPLTLLRHHVRRQGIGWAMEQTYLNPSPAELVLRDGG